MTSEYVVYPRLKKAAAEKLAISLGSQPIAELASEYSGNHQVKIEYAPTGSRVLKDELQKLQNQVRICAAEYGYPDTQNTTETNLIEFDKQCAVLLHQTLNLVPAEAAHIEVWSFMTCVLLPDVVRWRFHGSPTPTERFIGSDRGLRRNTLGRLWWRAYLLHQPNHSEPYEYIYRLGEDELVQITERRIIATNPVLISACASAFVGAVENYPNLPRRDLMREAVKRIRRLISLLCFEALDDNEVVQIMNHTFEQTLEAILKGAENGTS